MKYIVLTFSARKMKQFNFRKKVNFKQSNYEKSVSLTPISWKMKPRSAGWNYLTKMWQRCNGGKFENIRNLALYFQIKVERKGLGPDLGDDLCSSVCSLMTGGAVAGGGGCRFKLRSSLVSTGLGGLWRHGSRFLTYRFKGFPSTNDWSMIIALLKLEPLSE